jgi:23S rRNA pseudouridine2605 synthase
MRDRSNSRPKSGSKSKGKPKGTKPRAADGDGAEKTSARGTRGAARGAKPRKAAPTRAPKDDRPEGDRPASKRAGRRPPKALRTPGAEGARGPARSGRPGAGRSEEGTREARPERGWRERDMRTKRDVGRGPDRGSKRGKKAEEGTGDGRIRLNRFLANAGICSRREADDLITAGVVQVNGAIVTELGTKVGPSDRIHYGGQRLSTEKKRYVLLNKPKDFITTTDDPRDRRTVMALVESACNERLYPVGRLDRHTTGVLLMTNDGDLAKKLTHPSHGAEKIYHATLDKNMTKADLEKLVAGITLDDGPANADEASYVVGGTKKEVGLKIHMGRNRIVRRMFLALGYTVMKLDRVVFAGLTKKDVPRGKWRHLSEKEVLFLSKRK